MHTSKSYCECPGLQYQSRYGKFLLDANLCKNISRIDAQNFQ